MSILELSAAQFGSNLYSPGDWLRCNDIYGTGLFVRDCLDAADQLPSGSTPVRFGPARGGISMPVQRSYGEFLL